MHPSNYLHYTAEELAADESFRAYYLSADPAAVSFWQQWIAQHPEKEEEVSEAIALLDVLFSRLPDSALEAQLQKFSAAIQFSSEQPRKRIANGWRIAAVVALLAMVSGVGYWVAHRFEAAPAAEAPVAPLVHKATNKGQKMAVTLPDGTRVHLNSASQLSYPARFEDQLREVHLRGEAYFEVTSDSLRPFIVRSEALTTRVLGTSFNVKVYADTSPAVVLEEGQVRVVKVTTGDSVLLHPSERAYLDRGRTLRKTDVDPRMFTAWRDGIIRFDRASFEEIQQTLERWYDVEFRYSRPPTMEAFSGAFKNQSLRAVMEGISFSVGFSYRIEEKTVIINP